MLEGAGVRAELVPTTGPNTAGGIASAAIADGAELILAAGGDGTINEVAEGMLHSGVPLGILPAGTANVLANEMRLGSSLERAAAGFAGWRPFRISAGRVKYREGAAGGARHFLLMAGAGLDAHLVYHVSGPLKAQTGKFAYWVAGMKVAGRSLEEFRATVDGRDYTCSFALVSKVRNYGGDFQIARDTSLFDDRFEVVLFEGRQSLRYIKYLLGVALNRVSGMRGVTVLRARRVDLSPAADRRVYLQVDGEYAGRLPATVEIVPDALTLMVPPEYAAEFAHSK